MTTDDRRVAEALAEIERLKAERDHLRKVIDNGLRDYMTLEAERDALRADAERYRWLRDGDGTWSTRWSRWRIEHWASPGPTWSDIRGTDLDAAIDAALAKGGRNAD